MIIYLTGTKPALSHTINENGIIQFRPKTGLVPSCGLSVLIEIFHGKFEAKNQTVLHVSMKDPWGTQACIIWLATVLSGHLNSISRPRTHIRNFPQSVGSAFHVPILHWMDRDGRARNRTLAIQNMVNGPLGVFFRNTFGLDRSSSFAKQMLGSLLSML